MGIVSRYGENASGAVTVGENLPPPFSRSCVRHWVNRWENGTLHVYEMELNFQEVCYAIIVW